jgi:PAS domain S-box-containing protein
MLNTSTYDEQQKRITELEAQQQLLTDDRKRAEDALRQGEARLSFSLELNEAIGQLDDSMEVQTTAACLLGGRLQADRVFYGEIVIENGIEMLVIERDYCRPGVSSLTGRFAFREFSNTDYENYRAGQTVCSPNVFTDGREQSQSEAYRAVDVAAFIGVPLVKRVELVAVLGVLQRQPRNWTPEEISLAEQTLDRTWHAVQRARTEEAVRAVEREKALILDSVSEVIAYHDLEHNLVWANKAYLDSLGMSLSELKGKKCYTCWGLDRLCRNCSVTAAIQTCQPQEGELTPENQPHWPTDQGSWIVRSAPVKDSTGKVIGAIEISHNITERKRAEEALRESEERFRVAQELSPDGFSILRPVRDSEGRIVDFTFIYENAAIARINGTDPAAVVGRRLSEFLPAHSQSPFHEAHAHVADTGETCIMERKYDGGDIPRPTWFRVVVVRTGQDIAILSQDITERKQAEEALLQLKDKLERRVEERTSELAQRAIQLRALAGELTLSEQRERSRLAKVLHDHLQQLLVAAKFRITVMGRGGDDVTKQASTEVEELIDESIAASRSLTAELSPPILHEAGLNAGLQWLARRMPEMQGLFVELELEDGGDLPQDIKLLLFESVRELLFNVVKHAHTRSARVNVRRIDSQLQVIVSDHGSGFDLTALPAAGERGGGFGLFSIRERLGLMGGVFEIKSTPGQGSRFVLSVPVAPAATIEPPPHGIPVLPEAHIKLPIYPYPSQGQKIRVMLADDHAVVRQGMANLLEDEPDMEVVGQAADGQEAVEAAARLLPDVILMDMSMPKLNGVEATRIIHNDWPEIRIIGLSMFEEAERAQAMRDAGAVDYITKSGPAEDLINVIRTSIGTSKDRPTKA